MDTTTGQTKSKKLMNGYTKYFLNYGAAALILYFFVWPAWNKGVSYMDTAKEELPKQSLALEAIEKKVAEQDTAGVIEKLDDIKEAHDQAAAAVRQCHEQQIANQATILNNQESLSENQTAILGKMKL